jgi:putative PEP-CTERM system TPR-repeat lipoprotein
MSQPGSTHSLFLANARRMPAGAVMLLGWVVALAVQASPKSVAAYDDAAQRLEKGDLAGAVVQLKNALQDDRQMLAAHLLLGKTLLRLGELKAAEASFEAALRLGVNPSEVVLPLGQLYLQLGEGHKLLAQVQATDLPARQQAEVLTLRGMAQMQTGDSAKALVSFAEARRADAGSAAPYLAEAPVLLRNGDREKARAMLLKAGELAPTTPAPWYALGDLLDKSGDTPGALAQFDKALGLDAKFIEARLARAGLLLKLGRDGQAVQDLDALKAQAVKDPRIPYLRGVLAGRRNDAVAATTAFGEAVSLINPMVPTLLAGNESLLMAGALSNRALGNRQKARELLEILLGRNARHTTALMLAADMALEANDLTRALPLVEQLQKLMPDDPDVLYLRGTLEMSRKRLAQASEYFERAVAGKPSPDNLRELGLVQLGLGRQGEGLANLEKVFATNPKDTRAGVQLAMTYARLGDAAKALPVAETLVKNEPGNLAMVNFLANVKGRLGDKPVARVLWNKVLAQDGAFRPAVINLSWLDIEEGRFDMARTRLMQALSRNGQDPDLLYELGTLEARARRPAEALRYWQRADEGQRNDIRPGVAMLETLVGLRQFEKAQVLAKNLSGRYPDRLEVVLAQARVQMASGDKLGARQSLRDATRLGDNLPDVQTQIGRMNMALGQLDDAAYNVRKAQQVRPGDLASLVMQVEIDFRRGDSAAVDVALKALVARHPTAVPTLLTRGNVALARKQASPALADFEAAMSREPSTMTALMLSRAQVALGQTDKAMAGLAAWSAKQPGDRMARIALAELQALAGQGSEAIKSYKQLLQQSPDDAPLAAAYASLLYRTNDPGALVAAQRAAALAPADAAIQDLAGWVQVQRGDLPGGLQRLRDARLRSPTNGDIRVHLAYALSKAGQKAEAKTELLAALSGAHKPSASPELSALKTELGV